MSLLKICGLLLLLSAGAASQTGTKPEVMFLDRGALQAAQAAYTTSPNDPPPAVASLMKEANEALTARPLSVVSKKQAPPSGDKHDYMSLAPYWWPDTTKPDGLPYIRRDGERNPEHAATGDRQNFGRMVDQVRTLALAYYVSGQEMYAEGARTKLSVWFLDPATRMNPNLKYAQAVRGHNEGRGTGIIDTHGCMDVIDAIILLRASKQWTNEMDRGMQKWFTEYLVWLLESPNGKDEAAAKNNHGSIYDVQVSAIALFVGKEKTARAVLRSVGTKRISVQIEPDGSQPLELARTKSWGYCMLNTEALVDLAELGSRTGVDLWHYTSKDGRSLRRTIEYLLPFALGEKKWTTKQIVTMEPGRLYPILKRAAIRLKESSYAAAADRLKNKFEVSSRTAFSLPVK